jgi:hypothetical protein
MKSSILSIAFACAGFMAQAQTDTTGKTGSPTNQADTLHIGNMVIIRDGNSVDDSLVVKTHNDYKPSNISTNWFIVDLGFNNYVDNTNYASAPTQLLAPGSNSNWFNLRNGKSVNVNIWLFMQRVNLIKHVVNFKYGLGVELNNYRYSSPILYSENPNTLISYDALRHYKKNKLAADYVTVPLMLNFNLTPHRKNSFGFSVGASAGYLYSSRQKIVTSEDGKQKKHDDFGLDPWKMSWVGELQLGVIKFYGSYATKSMFKNALDQTPYNFGIRLSNW